ncbi:hypothetical protein J2046_000026 [Rhizobium petrolearium]|nr:hypothetical protein [Neorhizobium petrolearium]
MTISVVAMKTISQPRRPEAAAVHDLLPFDDLWGSLPKLLAPALAEPEGIRRRGDCGSCPWRGGHSLSDHLSRCRGDRDGDKDDGAQTSEHFAVHGQRPQLNILALREYALFGSDYRASHMRDNPPSA